MRDWAKHLHPTCLFIPISAEKGGGIRGGGGGDGMVESVEDYASLSTFYYLSKIIEYLF